MNTGLAINTAHVDIEGGWGGSSRSLFELIKRLDRCRIAPIVIHREAGPLQDWYKSIGIPTYHVPEIASLVPRENHVLKNIIARIPQLMRINSAARKIADITLERETDLIHLNYEGLFLLARRLQALTHLPMIGHWRTQVGRNLWGRWLAKSFNDSTQRIFFISPNERHRFIELIARKQPVRTPLACWANESAEVMWNIARNSLPRQPLRNPPDIVFLGNISESKGVLRIPYIARALSARGVSGRFSIYGQTRSGGRLQERISKLANDLAVADRLDLCGHITTIDQILSRAAVLIRPSCDSDPWGRDVIEATSAGVPVVATGTYNGVIEHDLNGLLVHPYSDEEFAAAIAAILTNGERWERFSKAGQHIGRQKFGGDIQVRQFTGAVEEVARRKDEAL